MIKVECNLVDCIKLDNNNIDKHAIHMDFSELKYKNSHAWGSDKSSIVNCKAHIFYFYLKLEERCDMDLLLE